VLIVDASILYIYMMLFTRVFQEIPCQWMAVENDVNT
jgi:hypothetical protein